MAKSSFDEKLTVLKSSLDIGRNLLDKRLKAKDEEIENLKKELELKTISTPDIDSFINKLKENLVKANEENHRLEIEMSVLKRDLTLAEQEKQNYLVDLKMLNSRLGQAQKKADELAKSKENDFLASIARILQDKIDEWTSGNYSKEEISSLKKEWLSRLQATNKKVENALMLLGHKPKRKSNNTLLGIVIAVAVIPIIISISSLFNKYFYKDVGYSTPFSNPSAIMWDGKSLWSSDWLAMSIIKHDMVNSLAIDKRFTLNSNPFGLAWDGHNIWSTDTWAKKINKHSNDSTLSVIASFDSPGTSPVGLCWDGTNIWSVDSKIHKIYKHKMDSSLSVIDKYDSPGNSPSGVFWDGKSIWTCDSGLNRIYKHNMDDTLSVENIYIPRSYVSGKSRLIGITGDGKYFWTIAEGTNKIFKHNLSSMVKLK